MSSPARLLLVSALPGVDTGRLAKAVHAAARQAGRQAAVVHSDGPEADLAYASLWSAVADGPGAILGDLGLGILGADEAGTLPGLVDLATALAACEAVADDRLVIWDAGSGQMTMRALTGLAAAQALLERVITPRTLDRAQQAGHGALAAIDSLGARLGRACEVLSTVTAGWLVAPPGQAEVERAQRLAAGLELWQIPVWIQPDRRGVADAGLLAELDRCALAPAAQRRWVEGSAEDGYRLCLRLPHAQRDWLRVGRVGSSVILAQAGWRRRLALPPVLKRCVLQGAALEDGLLTIRLLPDASAWMRTRAAGEHADG